MKTSFLAAALTAVIALPSFATSDVNTVTSLNGVEVVLQGTQAEPNNVIVQAELPVIEFDGLTFKGGQQIVAGYNDAFGATYYQDFAKRYNDEIKEEFTAEEIKKAVAVNNAFIEDFPRIKAFIEGIADASGASVEHIQLAFWAEDALFSKSMLSVGDQLFDGKEFTRHGEDDKIKGCTAVGFTNGILGQNMDLPLNMSGESATWKSDELIASGPSPFHPVMSMSRNMASNTNTIDAFSTVALENGISIGLMYITAITHNVSVDEAEVMMSKYQIAGAASTTLADKKGGLKTFEWHANGFKTFDQEDGYIVHTNHPRDREQELADVLYDGDLYEFNKAMKETVSRYEVASVYAKYDLERSAGSIKDLLTQRPILLAPTADNYFISSMSNVSDINAGCQYVAPYRPDLTGYTAVCFDK
ncbi:hypothetical protein F9L16_19415 [Agarivorans sp. B2Z047]|uniref:hypothetical protein n=1 Tax=Agarivorans sp. B2Z047 TaxID=2652721 RepID=UPI00128C6B92|nr:hypothetical protein [Agarivorans sp. B2Z047]MPW31147.1 hypothetical protein [Agarivorans sp. B2Z047]UQN42884.1 hypothetical protein LQZ07_24450 [Agarivorans sp. B2Z047]